MPELPEVETMVRDLTPRIVGRSIAGIDAPFTGSVVYPSYAEFEDRLRGQPIVGISRRGKYAIFELGSGDLLVVHRGMTGSLLLRTPDAPMESHVRLVFRLDDGLELRFNDQRKFGKVLVLGPDGVERPLPWQRMGPEPMNGEFSLSWFTQALERRTAPIKPLLLGQQVVAGLGNIYVDEALHLARIHPRTPANALSRAEVRRLHAAIRDVLIEAVEGRGTTFSNYADIEGRAGQYQSRLRVFHRAGEPCPRCATPIERLVVGGRGTHICPRCQRLKPCP